MNPPCKIPWGRCETIPVWLSTRRTRIKSSVPSPAIKKDSFDSIAKEVMREKTSWKLKRSRLAVFRCVIKELVSSDSRYWRRSWVLRSLNKSKSQSYKRAIRNPFSSLSTHCNARKQAPCSGGDKSRRCENRTPCCNVQTWSLPSEVHTNRNWPDESKQHCYESGRI